MVWDCHIFISEQKQGVFSILAAELLMTDVMTLTCTRCQNGLSSLRSLLQFCQEDVLH